MHENLDNLSIPILFILILIFVSSCITSKNEFCETNPTVPIIDTSTTSTIASTITQVTITTSTTTTIPIYERLAQEIALRETIPHGYDCNDKAMDFCKLVHVYGYPCKVCWGTYYGDSETYKHVWSMIEDGNKTVYIELLGGYIIPEDIYNERYLVTWKCV